jgi:3-deoxy-D-manno-octulosonate 8-phosphate phosphatase (KDO 8-P phosphatase)
MARDEMDHDLRLKAASLRWILADVDGVMTDGRLRYTADGETLKVFHVRDGLAIKLAQRAGLKVGVLSGRGGPPLEARAREIGLDEVMIQRDDKGTAFQEFLDRHGVRSKHVAYVGDDLVDLPALLRCGLSFAPADAAPQVLERVDCRLTTAGGAGALREMVEHILRARGDWDRLVEEYLTPRSGGRHPGRARGGSEG